LSATGIKLFFPPERKPNLLLDQAAPVQNTWYTILPSKSNVRIHAIAVEVEVSNESLETRITIDSNVLTDSLGATAGTTYYMERTISQTSSTLRMNSTNNTISSPFLVEGRNIKIEVRKTTNNGAGNLKGCVEYSLW
jgi:hypothetical protein